MGKTNVKPAEGKLGILVVGCGAVSTTFMTGVLMTRKGLAKPVGSMTQYDKIRIGKGDDKKYVPYNEIVSLANLNDIISRQSQRHCLRLLGCISPERLSGSHVRRSSQGERHRACS